MAQLQQVCGARGRATFGDRCWDHPLAPLAHCCSDPELPAVQAEDLDGRLLYQILDIQPRASPAEIRQARSSLRQQHTQSTLTDMHARPALQAYRLQARRHHPDKPGGSSARFARIQEAFETLADPKRRAVYDTWAKDLRFRYLDEHRVRFRMHATTRRLQTA